MVFQKNQRFGKVVLLNETKKMHGRYYQKIRCDCGTVKYIRNDRFPNVTSCNCERRNKVGLSTKDNEKLYNVWKHMINRCYDPRSDRYYAYGKKGITVCDEWKDDFHAFAEWAVSNGWNSGLSIERIDYNGMYCPENCTFVTMAQQARNKTTNVMITLDGETKCVAEWCDILQLDAKTVYARIYRGIVDPQILLYTGDLRDLRKEVFG